MARSRCLCNDPSIESPGHTFFLDNLLRQSHWCRGRVLQTQAVRRKSPTHATRRRCRPHQHGWQRFQLPIIVLRGQWSWPDACNCSSAAELCRLAVSWTPSFSTPATRKRPRRCIASDGSRTRFSEYRLVQTSIRRAARSQQQRRRQQQQCRRHALPTRCVISISTMTPLVLRGICRKIYMSIYSPRTYLTEAFHRATKTASEFGAVPLLLSPYVTSSSSPARADRSAVVASNQGARR